MNVIFVLVIADAVELVFCCSDVAGSERNVGGIWGDGDWLSNAKTPVEIDVWIVERTLIEVRCCNRMPMGQTRIHFVFFIIYLIPSLHLIVSFHEALIMLCHSHFLLFPYCFSLFFYFTLAHQTYSPISPSIRLMRMRILVYEYIYMYISMCVLYYIS